jgi:hypothetical protein
MPVRERMHENASRDPPPPPPPPPAGFPLTDTELGRAFAVTTGHDVEGADWAALAGVDTLVILMGGAGLPAIAERLAALGKPPATPVSAAGAPGRGGAASSRGGGSTPRAGCQRGRAPPIPLPAHPSSGRAPRRSR